MTDSDNGFRILDNIRTEFRDFLKTNGAASETDTRVKLIDRILKEVLGWSESAIKREPHVESGYIDYQLSLRSKQIICVEAKREAIGFTIPTTLQQHKSFALDGTLVTDIAVKTAVQKGKQYF